MQKKVKDIIAEVCKKHGIPAHIGIKLTGVPYKILKEETAKAVGSLDAGDYPTVVVPFLGSFKTSQIKIDRMTKGLTNNKEDGGIQE